MKKLLLIAVVLVIAVWAFLSLVGAKNYKDVTYTISGEKVTIGKEIQYFGNEVRTDLDGDGREDVAFIVTQDMDGGLWYYLVGALNTSHGYVGTHGVLIGDRIAPQTTESGQGKIVVVNYAKDNVGKSLYLLLDKETLEWGEVAQDFEGEQDLIMVDLPQRGSVVGKDFSVIGRARGNWYFEASFPVKLLDKNGKVIATAIAQAQVDPTGDGASWMTTNFVPFRADLHVPQSFIGPATLVLQKDNPSGLPEHDASISFPITVEY